MGIFNRISDIFKANVNDALDNAEDPEKMIKQMVLEMEESVNKSTLAVAQAVANQKSIERKMQNAKANESDWHEKAKKALGASNESLAKQALEKKAMYTKQISDLEPTHNIAKTSAEKLRSQLDQLKNKLEEARMRKSTLIARAQSAKAQKNISQNFSGVGSDAFSKFDKFESKVDTLEAEADAFGELHQGDAELENAFKDLESSSTDAELEKLKAEMNK
ncbi:PspA/IM30 family protein [Candidatus Kapabacteria bacterium]|nr:PspA/IM30 family protein [Candidatus Kapabacteria bacterium]